MQTILIRIQRARCTSTIHTTYGTIDQTDGAGGKVQYSREALSALKYFLTEKREIVPYIPPRQFIFTEPLTLFPSWVNIIQ